MIEPHPDIGLASRGLRVPIHVPLSSVLSGWDRLERLKTGLNAEGKGVKAVPPPPLQTSRASTRERAFSRQDLTPSTIVRVHFVYIVRCADGTLYTGYARDPRKRQRMHNTGRGARYTSGRRPVSL